jgi:hypothetical protein
MPMLAVTDNRELDLLTAGKADQLLSKIALTLTTTMGCA